MSSKQIRSGAKAPGHRRHIVGRLMGYIKRGYKARFIIVLVCILVSAIANVAGSLFLGSLIDDYITPLLGAADPDFSGLVRALVMMGCLFLVGALCAYAYNRNMIVVSQGVQKTIRDDLFGHMQTLPIKYFDTHAHGDVMSVYTNDVDTLRQMFAQSIPQVINSSMTILGHLPGYAVHQRPAHGCGPGVRLLRPGGDTVPGRPQRPLLPPPAEHPGRPQRLYRGDDQRSESGQGLLP